MIDEGRGRLGNPALYAYEAGAIHENRRDYTRAVSEYLKGALAPEGGSAAQRRLIELSRRPEHRDLVDQVTAQLVAGQNPGAGSRIACAWRCSRRSFAARISKRFCRELVEDTRLRSSCSSRSANIASSRQLDAVRVQCLERQIELTQDPVDRMRLRLSLMQLHESRNDVAAARQVIDAALSREPQDPRRRARARRFRLAAKGLRPGARGSRRGCRAGLSRAAQEADLRGGAQGDRRGAIRPCARSGSKLCSRTIPSMRSIWRRWPTPMAARTTTRGCAVLRSEDRGVGRGRSSRRP